jgi:hypothetical protein
MNETIRKYQQEDLEDSSHFNGQFNYQNNRYDRYYDEKIKNIRLVVPWLIVIFGLFGNIMIIIIFSKKLRRSSSHAFCFIALAISDSLALIFMLLRALLKTEILNNLNASCKAIKFLYHYFLQTSSWCLVLLTLDRFIAVCFIFKYKNWCKKFHVLKIFIFIIIIVLCLNVHLLVYVKAFERKGEFADGISKANEKGRPPPPIRSTRVNIIKKKSYVCNVSIDDHPLYFKHIYKNWDIAHAVIYGALPFSFILVANFIIIYKLIKLQKKSSKYLSDGKSIEKDENDSMVKSYQFTIMLLTVSFTFLVLTSPISLYMATIYDNLTNVRISKREFIKVILRYLGYVNNAINFYIYFFTSEEFRNDVFILFRCCRSILPISKNSSIYTACTASTSLPDVNIETKPFRKPNESKLKKKVVDLNPIEEEETRERGVSAEYEQEKPELTNNIYRPKTKIIYSKPFEQRVSEFERETLYFQTNPTRAKENRQRIHKVVYDKKQKSETETEEFLPNQNKNSLVTHL